MDYNELLFAYYVRKEALEQVQEKMRVGTSKEDFRAMFQETIDDIVSSTQGIAYHIRNSLND